MTTATERNTPQPYANSAAGFSSPKVGTPNHGLAQPGSQHPQPLGNSRNKEDASQSQQSMASKGGNEYGTNNIGSETLPKANDQSRSIVKEPPGSVEGREQPAEEESGAARGEGGGESKAPPEPEGGYPEQRHAGKLEGVGPEYGAANRVGFMERSKGVKEQIKGFIKRDPELKKTGKERRTGELKRREKEQEESLDPFQNAKDDDSEDEGEKEDNEQKPGQATEQPPNESQETRDFEGETTEDRHDSGSDH